MPELARRDVGQLATVQVQPPILTMIEKAMGQGIPAEQLTQLFALYERSEKLSAAKEFAAAMSRFKQSCGPVEKRTNNPQFKTHVSAAGVQQFRKYASLEDIAEAVRDPLAENGLSYRWSDMVVTNGNMTLSCIVSHVGGHSESSSITLPVGGSAGCSEIQKYGIAQSYGMRYTMLSALGVVPVGEDPDGNDAVGPAPKISAEQVGIIETLIVEVKANTTNFLKVYGVATVADLPAAMFGPACRMLEQRRGAK